MCATNIIKNEKGMMLLNTLMFILFFGVIGGSLTLMVIADFKMQSLNMEGPRALYAAQSGVEYGMRGAMEYARNNSNLGGLHNYTETIDGGAGASAQVRIVVTGSDSLTIISSGITGGYSQTITKGLSYEDVARYAVYTTGTISNVDISGASTRQNATHMPVFDHDALKTLAQPHHYFPGNLTINSPFSFNSAVAYIENDLTFTNWNLLNIGNFVAGGNINLNTNLISIFSGTMYQPNPAAFNALGDKRLYIISGGLVVNGNLTGVRYKLLFWWLNNIRVSYNRNRINDLMQYSVNGGPLVITNSNWQRAH